MSLDPKELHKGVADKLRALGDSDLYLICREAFYWRNSRVKELADLEKSVRDSLSKQ